LLPVFFGLLSALSWGAGDFAGGLASRKASPYRVLFLAEFAGLVLILALAAVSGEPIPSPGVWAWGAAASLVGTVGLLFLYRALASGRMTIAAPLSALLSAVVPVTVGFVTQGNPGAVTFAGFVLALVAVMLISGEGSLKFRQFLTPEIWQPLLAGVFFGLYFVLMHRATQTAFYWPLVSARLAGTIAIAAYALIARLPLLPGREVWRLCLVSGALDVGGNAFYVLSSQAGRMDVAAVLAALYPATTVLLAWAILHEHISRLQTAGIILALFAIILLTIQVP
jgi:drug/metabolite transporter (DMT)-like permease